MKYDYHISVCLITYNQENTVEQALLSILNQNGNLSIEILIGDDASNDKTFEILSKFKSKYPKNLKIFRRLYNVGATKNLGMLLDKANGKYIAILEGDDYWLTNSKLNEQIQYMENNNDVGLCFHTTNVYFGDKKVSCIPNENFKKEDYNFNKLLRFGPFIHLSSVFFRKSIIAKMPTLFYLNKNICDYSLLLILSESSKISYLPNIYSVYRLKSSASSWSSADEIVKAKLSYEYLLLIDSYYSNKYSVYLSEQIIGYMTKIILYHWRAKDYSSTLTWIEKLFTSNFIIIAKIRALLKILFMNFFENQSK